MVISQDLCYDIVLIPMRKSENIDKSRVYAGTAVIQHLIILHLHHLPQDHDGEFFEIGGIQIRGSVKLEESRWNEGYKVG